MDRLTIGDLAMVLPEEFGWPQDIGALAILDGRGLVGPDGAVRIEMVRRAVEGRLHLVPRFRQLLHTPPPGLGLPIWVDAPAFDIADHVDRGPGEPPADEAQLLLAVEELRRRRLEPSRPLWRMWFLTGLPDGRVALFMKLHHAIADGVAGIALLGAFLDQDPGAPPALSDGPPWVPAPMPSARAVFADNLRRHVRSLDRVRAGLAHPVDLARRVRAAWPAVREIAAQRVPRTSLNRPIGAERALRVVRTSLPLAKQAAHAQGGKLNDVLLAAVAGGLRELLLARGEQVDRLVLRAMVPVSLHGRQPGPARGNLDGAMAVPLPVGVPDPVRRLQQIAADTAERKRKERPSGAALFPTRSLQRAFLRHAARQRVANIYVANVPGPPGRLYFAGAPVLEVLPLVPIMGNMTLGVGALSYAGQLTVTAVADRDTCPDVDVFTGGLQRSLAALAASVPAQAGARAGAGGQVCADQGSERYAR